MSQTSSTSDLNLRTISKTCVVVQSPRLQVVCPHYPGGNTFVQSFYPRYSVYTVMCKECGQTLLSHWVTQHVGHSCLLQELVSFGELSQLPRRRKQTARKYSQPITHLPSAGSGPSAPSQSSTSAKPVASPSIPRFDDPSEPST